MKVNLKVGDEILTGKFKNKSVEVKEFGTDDNGQPTVNGRPMLNFRIAKLMPKKKVRENKQMKITESRLKEIIQEEMLNELFGLSKGNDWRPKSGERYDPQKRAKMGWGLSSMVRGVGERDNTIYVLEKSKSGSEFVVVVLDDSQNVKGHAGTKFASVEDAERFVRQAGGKNSEELQKMNDLEARSSKRKGDHEEFEKRRNARAQKNNSDSSRAFMDADDARIDREHDRVMRGAGARDNSPMKEW